MANPTREPIPWALPQTGLPAGTVTAREAPPANWLSLTRIRSSMRAKLVVVGAGTSIVTLSLVAIVAIFLTRDAISDTVMNGLSAVATNQRQQIDSLFEHYSVELDGVANDTQVRQSLRHLIATGDDVDRFVLNQILTDRATAAADGGSFDLHDLSGTVLASSDPGNIGSNEYDPSESELVVMAGSAADPLDQSVIRLSAPVMFDGRVVGYATVNHGTEGLNSIVTSYIGRRDTGESIVIARDSNGNPRYLTSLRFNDGGDFYRIIKPTDSKRVELISLSGSSGGETDFVDYRGHKVFGVHHYMESADIGLVVKIDESEALSRLQGLTQALTAVILTLALITVFGAILVSRFMIDSISTLTKAADLFSRGKLDSRVAIDSTDEIGTLGLTFNLMAESIQSSSEELEQRVVERTADLKRSNQDLEQFAYVASHDLQEPLRMVSSYTQLLSKRYAGKLDETADEFIEFAVDGAKRMQNLINDLLTYSRSGRIESKYERLSMTNVMDEVIGNLQSRIDDAGVSVSVGEMPELVADRQQTVSILQNLISNAIKYRSDTRDAHVEIASVRAQNAWQFSVKDNGIGIDPAFTERIFTIFQRLHGREEYQGTGIGLAVVKKLVERSGGSIWVESKPDEGSTFFFTVVDRTAVEDEINNSDQDNDLNSGRESFRVAS